MFVSLSVFFGSQLYLNPLEVGCTVVDEDSSDPPTPPSRTPAFLFDLLLFIFLLIDAEMSSGRVGEASDRKFL